ncbi:MAG: ABC transporter substrate-binding protein [Acidobacteriota bacterium]
MAVSPKLSQLCVALGLLLGLLAGCATETARDTTRHGLRFPPPGAERVDSHGQTGGELHYALVGEPDTFNILAAQDSRSRLIALLTTGTLLEFDPVLQQVAGGAVSSFQFEEAGSAVRMHLRKGLKFSDGSPVTTADVAFTLDRIFDPDSRNALKDSLQVDGEALRLEVVSEDEFVLRAARPYAALEYLLSIVPVLPRHLLEGEPERPIEQAWTLATPPSEMAGLGPFTIARHEPGLSTTLERNPYYWKTDVDDVQLPYLDRIVFEYVSDRSARVLKLSSGDLDLSDDLRPEDFALLRGSGRLVAEDFGASNSLLFLWFNLNQPDGKRRTAEHAWFSQRAFRQAVNSAVNRQAIADTVYSGHASAAFSFVSPANRAWHVDPPAPSGDRLENARQLLRGAGFRWSRDGSETRLFDPTGRPVEFELLTSSDDLMGRAAAMLQQDLAGLGLRVNIRQEDARSVRSRIVNSRDYAAALMNLDFPLEPLDMTNVLASSGGLHVWKPPGGGNPEDWELEVDRLMADLATTLDHEARFELFKKVQLIMARECPLIPLVNRDVLVARSAKLQNLDVARVFPYAWGRIWKVYREQP